MKKPILLLLFFISFRAFAQYRDLYFEHLNVVDGLPESYVEALLQDKFGYVWIGTQNGLVRYDGYQLKVYKLGSEEKNAPKEFAIQDIFEDKNGVLWVSSRNNSIYRYDRDHDSFHEFRLSKGASGNNLSFSATKIVEGDQDHLWLVQKNRYKKILDITVNKLRQFNTKTGAIISFPYLATSAVNSKTGKTWFGTDKGLVYFDRSAGKMTAAFNPADHPDKTKLVENLYEAPSAPGVLWFTRQAGNDTLLGLYSFDIRTKLFRKYQPRLRDSLSIATDSVFCIHEDRRKRLWFGTSRGLSLLDRKTGHFTNYTPPLVVNKVTGGNAVTQIVEQANGNLWLGAGFEGRPGAGKGLLWFNPLTGAFKRYQHDGTTTYSLNNDDIVHLLIDHSGLLWLGLAWGGLDRVNTLRSQFDHYEPVSGNGQSYPVGGATGIALGPGGLCWLGSHQDGLVNWKPNTNIFERKKLPAYLAGQPIAVLGFDRNGLLWGRAQRTRIFTYNPKSGTTDTLNYPGKWPVADHATRVLQDHTGLVWIGTDNNGLYSYKPGSGKFTAYPCESTVPGLQYTGKKLDDDRVLSIYEDKQNVLWIGTNFGGLNRFNRADGTFSSYLDRRKGLTCVANIFEDKEGRLWLSTYLDGLFLFDRKTAETRQFTENDGLLSDAPISVFEDKGGKLWITSDRGLSTLDPKTNVFGRFTLQNAMQYSLGGAISAAAKTKDGEIICAGPRELFAFYPDKLTKNNYPPQVYIESLVHNDPQAAHETERREITLEKSRLDLPHNQNRITFNYLALHFETPSQNQYAYQLVGYDKNWVQAGAQRSITYTNLPPGTYTFRVKAANSDGVWNEKGAWLVVIIRPPWWETWWALTLFALAAISLVWAIVYYRSRSLLRAKHLLEQKVQLRTKEVLDQKEEIETQRDHLEHTLGELQTTQSQLVQREKMASLGELTAGIAHEIQNPLNFVNNFSEINTELIDELQDEIDKGAYDEAKALAVDIKENQQKINQHGKRADFIVKGMLQHSRTSTGEKQLTNINVLADEFFKLSYHGLRAKDKEFNAELITHFDPDLPPVNIVQQDIGRVLLNLFNNGFYAVAQKQKTAEAGYKPEVSVTTAAPQPPEGEAQSIVITVKDNGVGIPDAIKEKIMQPFFTTKPTGEGTGLGLSLTYDMVVKGHGGTIKVDSKEHEFTEFTITLPL